jgi:hypothetical protein
MRLRIFPASRQVCFPRHWMLLLVSIRRCVLPMALLVRILVPYRICRTFYTMHRIASISIDKANPHIMLIFIALQGRNSRCFLGTLM